MKIETIAQLAQFADSAYVEYRDSRNSETSIEDAELAEKAPASPGSRDFVTTSWPVADWQPDTPSGFAATAFAKGAGKVLATRGAEADSAADLLERAGSEAGVRCALATLQPFGVTGSAQLYRRLNGDGACDPYDAERRTGALTPEYLADRPRMLRQCLSRNGTEAVTVTDGPHRNAVYVDHESGVRFSTAGPAHVDPVLLQQDRHLLFGDEGVQTLGGSTDDDLLYGYDGNDRLAGSVGSDTLDGGAGDDLLVGGELPDVLMGGAGADRPAGGLGSDVLDGEPGDDLLLSAGANRLVAAIAGFRATAAADWAPRIEAAAPLAGVLAAAWQPQAV